MSKTLIITGTVENRMNEKNEPSLFYDLVLYGQSEESPLVQFIKPLRAFFNSYTPMQEQARAIYADYFKTDLFNIISLENINRI